MHSIINVELSNILIITHAQNNNYKKIKILNSTYKLFCHIKPPISPCNNMNKCQIQESSCI